jgi:hypothetical protein
MLYTILNIPNIDKIKKELNEIVSKDITGFSAVDTEIIKSQCFELNNFLKSINLLDRWKDTGIVVLNNSSLVVHSDSIVPWRIYALNIPIYNCENSYTIWYKVKNGAHPTVNEYGEPNRKVYSFQYNSEDVEEIDRMESSNAAFVNVKVPHSGISMTNSVRCLISLRFVPNITEEEILNISSCYT